MLIFLFVGYKGIEITSECDVNNVLKRHKSYEERNSEICKNLRKELLENNI